MLPVSLRIRVLWIEYAHPDSRSITELEHQKNHQMAYCDVWMCVCQKANEDEVRTAVGNEFYRLRGSQFREFLQNIGINKTKYIDPSSSPIEA